jgi:hypothetical protein
MTIIGSRHNIKCNDGRKIGLSQVWMGVQNFIFIVQNCTKKKKVQNTFKVWYYSKVVVLAIRTWYFGRYSTPTHRVSSYRTPCAAALTRPYVINYPAISK